MWKSVPWKSEWMLAFYGVQKAFFKAHCNKEPHVMHFIMSGLLDYSSLETLKTHFHCDPIYDLLWVIPREKLVQNFIYTNTKSWIIQSIHFFFLKKKWCKRTEKMVVMKWKNKAPFWLVLNCMYLCTHLSLSSLRISGEKPRQWNLESWEQPWFSNFTSSSSSSCKVFSLDVNLFPLSIVCETWLSFDGILLLMLSLVNF